MPVTFQLAVDCADPAVLTRFWSAALGYQLEDPPDGYDSWSDFWRAIGLPEGEVDDVPDSIVDPSGAGPRIWFQRVPEPKSGKNRLHLDLTVSGGRSIPITERRTRVENEARRLVDLGASRVNTLGEPGLDHYAVAMRDPEGNEFDLN